MAAFTKEMLLSYLEERGITIEAYDHPIVMTVEEQAKYVGHLDGAHSKNLFLKDKKSRLYLVSALTTTNVDLKILSQRLGLGKGGLRMAPEDTLLEVLKVPLGSVTPFALINSSARSVAFILDQHFKGISRVFFHPLSNDSTIALPSAGFETFLRSIGREPSYVDLEAVIAVGKDMPPDLATYVPSIADQGAERPINGAEEVAAVKNYTMALKKPLASALTVLEAKQKTATKEKATEIGKVTTLVEDPQNLVDYILDETVAAVLVEVKAETGDESGKDLVSIVSARVKEQLAPDLQSMIMIFKNTAYTEGFSAGVATRSLSRPL